MKSKIVIGLAAWWRNLFDRRRLSLLNTHDNHEVWHTHISPANIFMALVATFVLLFIAVLTLVGYSPILEYLPGYRSDIHKSRQDIINNIIRLDSMERVIHDMVVYTDNISLIMEGKTPVVRSTSSIDSIKLSKSLVAPNAVDSVLRNEMEGDGRYSLRIAQAMSSTPISAPTHGVITRRFNIAQKQYGVKIATAADEPILAAQHGVVMFKIWSPESGYSVQILHADNQITIYHNLADVIVERGESVKSGEVIGYMADPNNGSIKQGNELGFELWIAGSAVDPERYIIF